MKHLGRRSSKSPRSLPPPAQIVALPAFSRGDDRLQGTVRAPAQGQNTIQITLKNKKGIVRDHVSSVVEANGNFTAAFSNGIKLACGDTISLKYYVLAEENYVLNCPDPGAPTPTVPREGDISISGKAGDAASLSIDVFSGSDFIETASGKADDRGQFSVSFKSKLAPG